MYKNVLRRAATGKSLNESAVKSVFKEQPAILSRKADFALRAWACHVGAQGVPDKPDVIDTSTKDAQACSTHWACIIFP